MNFYVLLKTDVMKFPSIQIALVTIAAAGLFSFFPYRDGSIRGSVTPAEGGVRAWAESADDTLKTPIINGSYEITGAKPGTYKVIIEAKPPYQNAAKDGVMVNDGQTSDAGEITLKK
jgi:hypothetical protein